MSTLVRKRLINVDEYYKMGETGMFHPEERIELINGEICTMAPIGSKHAAVVDRLSGLLQSLNVQNIIIRSQNPIHIDQLNELEPDIAILEYREDGYYSAHPEPPHVRLIIEVSDTTFDFDRNIKLPIYASVDIRVYWIVNINDKYIEVFEQPKEDFYQKRTRYIPGDTIPFQSKLLDVSRILMES